MTSEDVVRRWEARGYRRFAGPGYRAAFGGPAECALLEGPKGGRYVLLLSEGQFIALVPRAFARTPWRA